VRVLRACESESTQPGLADNSVKVRGVRNAFLKNGTTAGAETLVVQYMLNITALIAEHIDLDLISQTDEHVKSELAKISSSPLCEYLFTLYLDFARMPIPQHAPSLCLGSLFRAYPVLILQPEAMVWMDGVFGGGDVELHSRLLRVIWDFLKSESEKKAVGSVGAKRLKDMEALIGNTVDLSESG
jgi:cohesin loading factor subunit SCC2